MSDFKIKLVTEEEYRAPDSNESAVKQSQMIADRCQSDEFK